MSQSVTAGSSESLLVSSWSLPAAVVMMTIDACTTDSIIANMSIRPYWLNWTDKLLIANAVANHCGSAMTLRTISTCGAGVTHFVEIHSVNNVKETEGSLT